MNPPIETTKAKPSDETALSELIPETVARFRESIAGGMPWHLALLQTVGNWTHPDEV